MGMLVNSYRYGSANDPSFANVSFLAGFESGLNDESANGHVGTLEDTGMSRSASGVKFGTIGLYSPSSAGGEHGNVSYPDHASLELGSSAFTIECWAFFLSTTDITLNTIPLVTKWEQVNQRGFVFDVNAGALRLITSSTGANVALNLSTGLSWVVGAGNFYHLAADFDGTKTRLFRDGVMVTSSLTTPSIFNSTAKLRLGQFTNGGTLIGNFAGALDEVRITKGVSRYGSDSSFTPPTAAFPRS